MPSDADTTSAGRAGAPLRRPGDREAERYVAPAAEPGRAVDAAVPGGSRCRFCEADNARERTLCVRCGRPLRSGPPPRPTAPPPVRLPWWKRAFRRTPESPRLAGERPAVRSRRPRRLIVPILVLALLAGAWFGRPFYDGVFDFVRDNTTDPEAAPPADKRASSEAPGMPAAAAFDGVSNKAWAPSGPGPGAELVATFDPPVRLLKVIVLSGYSTKPEEFLAYGRPEKLVFRVVGTDGEEHTVEIRLRDQPGQQTFDLRASDVREVHIGIVSVYGPADRPPAIAEVEFFRGR
ncbi:NADase-type glycan-binding domain-containing protein [Yinghuangia sp. YIM S09857]|uniref:NADase-type glycan-binding domain-containing protein n=1 Tax=Yinghuangia sp. YIM S09857 TaxID=3436929 RepID=UPI003F539F29